MARAKATHSPDFEKWAKKYARKGCTKAQLKRLVELEVITADEYKEITGEDYEA